MGGIGITMHTSMRERADEGDMCVRAIVVYRPCMRCSNAM